MVVPTATKEIRNNDRDSREREVPAGTRVFLKDCDNILRDHEEDRDCSKSEKDSAAILPGAQRAELLLPWAHSWPAQFRSQTANVGT